MNEQKVTMVRIYLAESHGQLTKVLNYLHDEAEVKGWTVYRGISGYSHSADKVRSVSLADLAMDLPVTIEFYEDADKAHTIIEQLSTFVDEEHIVYWTATMIGG
jgi:uncharacterized protein